MKLVLSDKQFEHIGDMTRHLMIMGSAGSGKTIFACTKVILYALEYPNARIGVFRQTLPSLRETAWREIIELLEKYNIEYKENKSNGLVTLSNGSTISFTPVDDEKKLRSLNLDFVYIEQCEEISEEAFIELDLRIRNEVSKKYGGQMLIVVQPSNKSHWLYRLFYQEKANDEDYRKIHFSYLDNPFLPEEQKKVYEGLRETNYERYLTHTMGEWVSSSKQIFTNNWSVGLNGRRYFNYYVGGIDWGYNSPACFLLCGVYDEEFYVLGEVYRAEMLNDEFLSRIDELLGEYDLKFGDLDAVYCDSADPEKIQYFFDAGLNTYPSVKDVKAKIETTKETIIHIGEGCVNLIREMPMYEWKRNKDGEILDEPVKKDDHSVDALCYCVYGVRGKLSKNKPVSTFDVSQLKIY
ncbi:MAG: PBSX family phage terminase large subunit [Paludibacteraceae bacterium]|nr:PBSX family phage terminase large subunit [Paludibacteraceae bacterium]